MPHVIVIAGPNGAGKTSSAGLSAFAPEKAAIQAGRAMLSRITELGVQGENFAFEMTLASRSFALG